MGGLHIRTDNRSHYFHFNFYTMRYFKSHLLYITLSFAAAWCDVLMELVDGVSWVTYQEATTTPLKMDRKPEDDDDQYFNITEVNNVFDDTTEI